MICVEVLVSVVGTISSLSDEKALLLFRAIAFSENDYSNMLITKLRLTRRQYYSIMKKLIDADLVKRISGKYSLTLFGKIVFSILVKIESAIKYYWKLKALDSIVVSVNAQLPAEEYRRIVDNLIDNDDIKNLIVSNNNNYEPRLSYSSPKEQEKREEEELRC
jgi:hypothetical protein